MHKNRRVNVRRTTVRICTRNRFHSKIKDFYATLITCLCTTTAIRCYGYSDPSVQAEWRIILECLDILLQDAMDSKGRSKQ